MTRTKTILFLAAGLLLLGSLAAAKDVFATSTTLVVNGYGDLNDLNPGDGICDGVGNIPGSQCGLRAAIEELNAQGPGAAPHRIEFDIAGTGPFTITLGSALPAIIVPVEIDGASQPGASCPTGNSPAELMIVLDGSGAGSNTSGLTLGFGSSGSTIRGLAVGNFEFSGIVISSDGNNVRCSHIGLAPDGVSTLGNGSHGIFIEGDSNTIGGQASHAQRNVISGNGNQGIRIEPGGENNFVAGNFVGTTADGMNALGNDLWGIYLAGNSNTIGSENSPGPNVVAANNEYGIYLLAGDDNLIHSNFIGVARDGVTALGNLGPGLMILGEAVGNVVGGSAGEANRIAFNAGDGVRVQGLSGENPLQNEIRQNAIFANGSLGIDLGGDGVDGNDPVDGDGGPNGQQNYPVLTATPGSYVVQGAIDGHPFTTYTIDVYRSESCDPSGYGEGQQYLTTVDVSTGGSGEEGFLVDLSGLVSDGDVVTATATDPPGNTSEFSACVTMSAAPTPTSTPTNTVIPPTNTLTPTATPTGTAPSPTWTATPGPSLTPTQTGTAGPSPTPTLTHTPGPSPTALPPPGAFRSYLPLLVK